MRIARLRLASLVLVFAGLSWLVDLSGPAQLYLAVRGLVLVIFLIDEIVVGFRRRRAEKV